MPQGSDSACCYPKQVWSLGITAGFFCRKPTIKLQLFFFQSCDCCKIPLICGSSRLFLELNRALSFPSLSMRLGPESPAVRLEEFEGGEDLHDTSSLALIVEE